MNEQEICLRLILDEAHSGQFNMAADEFLLKNQIQRKDKNAVLRFYRFSEPTLTIGYGVWKSVVPSPLSGGRQAAESEPRQRRGWRVVPPPLSSPTPPQRWRIRPLAEKGEDVIPRVRRITGGGIVLHGISDLTYSLIAPIAGTGPLRKVKDSYLLIHEQLSQVFHFFGIKTELFEKRCCVPGATSSERQRERNLFCFDSPVLHDVMFDGKKVAGAAQKRTQGYLLHQGSIAWNVILESCPDFSESAFFERFIHRIGDLFGLPVKKVPLPAEELKNAFAVI